VPNDNEKWRRLPFDLHLLIDAATKKFELEAIYFFGSRRFKTRSLRSDIDIFFIPVGYIKPSDVRDFIEQTCIALDIFVLHHGRAVSAINESYIELEDNAAVVEATKALLLWSSANGTVANSSVDWVQEYASHVGFEPTVLPNQILRPSIDKLRERLSQQGLPTDPIIGESEEEVARRLLAVARAIAEFKEADFPGKGEARKSFVIHPQSEYDFQDLFWLAIKPWVGEAARERVELVFDGQRKKSDFSLMKSRFILEMKFAKDENDKREIVKTLDGLANFYRENANVRFLLFIIYARNAAAIDRVAWETRYSDVARTPRIVVSVIQVP
jgi:REase_DpnII-MboI